MSDVGDGRLSGWFRFCCVITSITTYVAVMSWFWGRIDRDCFYLEIGFLVSKSEQVGALGRRAPEFVRRDWHLHCDVIGRRGIFSLQAAGDESTLIEVSLRNQCLLQVEAREHLRRSPGLIFSNVRNARQILLL